MTWQSPISPGISWYEATVPERPAYPAMPGSRKADVAIIGGGYTGLQAAYTLSKSGADVTLIDACRFGDGASGRNGGQLGTGQRAWAEDLEDLLGHERAQAMFDMAENAKRYLLEFAHEHEIDIEFMPGQLSVGHKASFERHYRRHVEAMAERFGYPHLSFMNREETASRLGSSHYRFGIRDTGTGHIHPMKLLVGLAKAAAMAGANLHERTKALKIEKRNGAVIVETDRGEIAADRALIACNAYIGNLEPVTASHVMPIRSFIGATAVLTEHPEVLPGGESVDDSRFVVRYFRRSRDGRLLFGGREAYTADNPRDISSHIRRQIREIYPALADVEIIHAWGGAVGITMPRQPFCREVMPGVITIGGYSGHGVMLSNYCGKLYGDLALGKQTELDLLKDLKIPAFPGGARFRSALLYLALSWYALRDRL
ncbi:glycine/D-amino acid oxidase-like deaminating enzyme [Sinorhizobium kostiense]|uniref:Glycine/D-amino acid oxidase-like deaminating enzyme n=1 Tax=Sinorhizobium kostiense TaxID=76747 RepID=A0ABS4QY79_9HYPH|nr:FAD-binding oxidoreductase [Sinorhizobium kostiense]MBP2235600.1 glycine/D-amino acid oxidase-like deaminating enzyme [Sinorhizobium kostiense]